MRPTGPGYQALGIGRPCTRGERLPTGVGGALASRAQVWSRAVA